MCVVDGSLIEVEFCARDNERSVYRGIGVHVCIAKLELIQPYGSIVVTVWIGELSDRLVVDVENGYSQAGEQQPFDHRSVISIRR